MSAVQRYRLQNLDARVSRLIEESFSKAPKASKASKDRGKPDERYMRAKRYLVSGDGQKTVKMQP